MQIFNTKKFSTQLLASGISKSRGVAILLSSRLTFDVIDSLVDPDGRYLFSNVKVKGEVLMLATLYAPNSNPLPFISGCLERLQNFSKSLIIAGGDLYCFSNMREDSTGNKQPKASPREMEGSSCNLGGLFDKYNLKDLWRCLHPGQKDFTFFSSHHNSHSQIDNLFVSADLLDHFTGLEIGLKKWSDHAWVEGTFFLQKVSRPRPQWRLNSGLLLTEPVHSDIEKEIEKYFDLNVDCGVVKTMVWDTMKAVVCGKILALSLFYRKQKSQLVSTLHNSIPQLEQ